MARFTAGAGEQQPTGEAGAFVSARVRCRRSEEGYNLVLLIILATVANLILAAGLEKWSTIIQRDKEEELIFRGMQYAEAIRIFQTRFGRLPVRLEELVETEPRSLRQLFPNPMTEDGSWGLLMQSQAPVAGGGGPPGRGGSRTRPQRPGEAATEASPDGAQRAQDRPGQATEGDQTRFFTDPQLRRRSRPGGGDVVAIPPSQEKDNFGRVREQRTTGPIVGVYAGLGGESFHTFMGNKDYESWHFRSDLVPVPVMMGGDQPLPRPNSGVFWKPFPEGIQVQLPQGTGPQGGQDLTGAGGAGRQGGGNRGGFGGQQNGGSAVQPRLPPPRARGSRRDR